MYRQGLGDCFLITFSVGGGERHMLIDCGTLGSTTTGVKLADVVADIRKVTGDHLDLLIATHEHWDHLRGFHDHAAQFDQVAVDNVWLAWTENPKDKLAQKVAKTKEDLRAALTSAATALTTSTNDQSRNMGAAVASILGFFGDDVILGATFSTTVNDAMNYVRTKKGAKTQFFKPGGGPIEASWLPGYRFYVLGPPYDEDALNDTGASGSSDLYGVTAGLRAGVACLLSGMSAAEYATAAAMDERSDFTAALPFDAQFRMGPADLRTKTWFRGTYFAESETWRRVDEDWLHLASDLALQLDDATNNTSLAIAIERIADGKVLLFPADAQQGNWLSWHDPEIKWTVDNNGRKTEIRAKDLLSRTVFYKVGHHSSHNATASAKGLELMDQENELTAFIPVDREVALGRSPQNSWRMPAVKLYRRLLEKCQGRVVRSDIGWADDAQKAAKKKVEHELLGIGKPAEWTKWRRAQAAASNVSITDLYIDYLLD